MPITDHWAKRLHEYCQDLDKEYISPGEWQDHVEQLFAHIELNELLKFIEFEKLIQGFEYPDLGVNTKAVRFPKLDGLPENTLFYKKIFGLKKGRSIIPHGHSNMASAHLVLKGDFSLKHYDKIQQEENHLIVKPTISKQIHPGSCSTISDERDNIHWFIADSETAFTFDVIMLNLNQAAYDIQNLDMLEAELIGEGLMRTPILNVETALKKYGKIHH